MKHKLKSVEEVEKEFDEQDFSFAGYGGAHFEFYSDVLEPAKKFLSKTLTSDRHAIGEMLLEWVKSQKIKRNPKGCYLKGNDGNIYIMDCEYGNCEHSGYNSALKDLETFIKSELMGDI